MKGPTTPEPSGANRHGSAHDHPEPDERRTALLLTADPLVTSRLDALAGELGLEPVAASAAPPPSVDVIVIDLDQPGSLDTIIEWRDRHPGAFIAGHMGLPRQDLWIQAHQAGCDLVANRGAFAAQLRHRLPPAGAPRRRLVPLLAAAELPGRIGLVLRAPESPVGPLAVFHLSGALYAVADHCPHAGATISEGDLAGTVLTCPRHGSQFDVRTGERMRGPADESITAFEVVEQDGFVQLVLG